jgi:hypothetical protein
MVLRAGYVDRPTRVQWPPPRVFTLGEAREEVGVKEIAKRGSRHDPPKGSARIINTPPRKVQFEPGEVELLRRLRHRVVDALLTDVGRALRLSAPLA